MWQKMNKQGCHGDTQVKQLQPAHLESEKANDIDGLSMKDSKFGQDLLPGQASKYRIQRF